MSDRLGKLEAIIERRDHEQDTWEDACDMWACVPTLIAVARNRVEVFTTGEHRCGECCATSMPPLSHDDDCPVAALDAKLAEVLGD